MGSTAVRPWPSQWQFLPAVCSEADRLLSASHCRIAPMVVIQQSTLFPEADIALADVTGCIGSVETNPYNGICRPLIQCARGAAMTTMTVATSPGVPSPPSEIRAGQRARPGWIWRSVPFIGEQCSEQHARRAGRTNG
jgi:hypothetical protein